MIDGKKTIRVDVTSRTAAMSMAAQLRLIADLLESGDMVSTLGGIKVNSNFSGEVTIESDLVLATTKQPKVDETTVEVEQLTLVDPVREAVWQMLDLMNPGQKKLTTFDHDESLLWNQWVLAINNRGEYPDYLKGRMFQVQPYRNLNELGFWTVRLT
jgi:hypothetical protein